MQPLPPTTSDDLSEACAHEVVGAIPPVIWFIREQMRPYRKGLSLPQFRVLVQVNAKPRLCLSTLAEHLGGSLPTTSRIVAGLVKKGLLVRKGCTDDRRQLSLEITRRGESMLGTAWLSVQKKMEEALAPLNDVQRAHVFAAMKALQTVFGKLELPSDFDSDGSDDGVLPRAIGAVVG
jgi:MarR family 2-MHQ and catechol resistance regulon transcriptional repressor